jgi:hypothetical protein
MYVVQGKEFRSLWLKFAHPQSAVFMRADGYFMSTESFIALLGKIADCVPGAWSAGRSARRVRASAHG